MSLIGRVKRGRNALSRGLKVLRPGSTSTAAQPSPRQAEFEFQLPNPFGGEPLYRARFCLTNTPNAHGETLRLQAHINGCLKLPEVRHDAPALPASQPGTGLTQRGRQAAGGLVRFGVSRLPARIFAPVLQQRLQTWMDVQISNAPLAAGADALIPERLRSMLSEVPRNAPGQPRIAGWVGDIDGPHPGRAQFTVLQMDQTDLPPELRAQPFNLSASFASTLVDESGRD